MSTLPKSDIGKLIAAACISAVVSAGGVLFATTISVAKNDVTMAELRSDISEVKTKLSDKANLAYTKEDAESDSERFLVYLRSLKEAIDNVSEQTDKKLDSIETRMVRNEDQVSKALATALYNKGILKSRLEESE